MKKSKGSELELLPIKEDCALIAQLLLVLCPSAWCARVQLQPALDDATLDAAPYLLGPHPLSVGEKAVCVALCRTVVNYAIAAGRLHKKQKSGSSSLYFTHEKARERIRANAELLIPQGTTLVHKPASRSCYSFCG